MTSATILYVTSNAEDPTFEEKIRGALLAVAGALPIISVSQKPIDLGENICVGERGSAYANQYRQLLIGATAAKTEWLIAAESDALYPPAYFSFVPPGGDLWRYNNVWILWRNLAYGSAFKKKRNSEGGQFVRREWFINRLEGVMEGLPEWYSPESDWKVRVYRQHEWQFYGDPKEPMISVKSGRGMRPTTQIQGGSEPADKLPFWGSADVLRKELFGG